MKGDIKVGQHSEGTGRHRPGISPLFGGLSLSFNVRFYAKVGADGIKGYVFRKLGVDFLQLSQLDSAGGSSCGSEIEEGRFFHLKQVGQGNQ